MSANPPDAQLGPSLPERFGFRCGDRGTQTSRTIMLSELSSLLAVTPSSASNADYRTAIVLENVLGKRTEATRKLTAQRMTELYALDPRVPLFRVLRQLWDADEQGRPLLACLCANARDPILRMTATPVLDASEGEPVSKHALADVVAETVGDRFNPSTLDKIARNAASSWTQSGHLKGRSNKARVRAIATPAATAYALALGRLDSAQGEALFHTYWVRLLDAPATLVDTLAFEASRRGWVSYRRVGGVVDIGFAGLLTEDEMEDARG